MEGKNGHILRIFGGAWATISAYGNSTSALFDKMINGESALKNIPIETQTLFAGKIPGKDFIHNGLEFENTLKELKDQIIQKTKKNFLSENNTLCIVSTTKGNILSFPNSSTPIHHNALLIKDLFSLNHSPFVVSNACTSGVCAITMGERILQQKLFDHIIIIGFDLLSPFVSMGFDSLHALSDERSKPYDKHRKGINLGEAFAGFVLSKNEALFKHPPIGIGKGAISNDAGHISGPSRTAAGLIHAVERALDDAQLKTGDIDFISSHGTATLYNDEMESVGFKQLKMDATPLLSMKPYFGHCLGAAGVIESIVCAEIITKQCIPPNIGFLKNGVSHPLNLATTTRKANVNRILKTASGFGGTNASIILEKC